MRSPAARSAGVVTGFRVASAGSCAASATHHSIRAIDTRRMEWKRSISSVADRLRLAPNHMLDRQTSDLCDGTLFQSGNSKIELCQHLWDDRAAALREVAAFDRHAQIPRPWNFNGALSLELEA